MPPVDYSKLTTVRVWETVGTTKFTEQIATLHQPAVLKGFAREWPVVARARQSPEALCDYIAAFDPEHVVEVFLGKPDIDGRYFYNDEFTGFNFEQAKLSLRKLLDVLLRHQDNERSAAFYAGAIPLRGRLAGIVAENPNNLLAPALEKLISLWVGNRGRTAAHWDLPQNIACVVAGRRRFTLFPTDQLPNLYIGPIDFTLAGQPLSLVDFGNPDFERFPRFHRALAQAQTALLEPGDAIYIPSMWFHQVESLDSIGMLINYWWRDAVGHMVTPQDTLIHALLSIRDMPEHERKAWRILFDHYIFGSGVDPVAHIPEQARGVLGPMTPELVSRIKQYLCPD